MVTDAALGVVTAPHHAAAAIDDDAEGVDDGEHEYAHVGARYAPERGALPARLVLHVRRRMDFSDGREAAGAAPPDRAASGARRAQRRAAEFLVRIDERVARAEIVDDRAGHDGDPAPGGGVAAGEELRGHAETRFEPVERAARETDRVG